jgi:hypothetical protein
MEDAASLELARVGAIWSSQSPLKYSSVTIDDFIGKNIELTSSRSSSASLKCSQNHIVDGTALLVVVIYTFHRDTITMICRAQWQNSNQENQAVEELHHCSCFLQWCLCVKLFLVLQSSPKNEIMSLVWARGLQL